MLEAEFTPRGARRPDCDAPNRRVRIQQSKEEAQIARMMREMPRGDGRVQSLCYAAPTAGCLTSPLASEWNRTVPSTHTRVTAAKRSRGEKATRSALFPTSMLPRIRIAAQVARRHSA
jgi:hypothetical protein